MSADLLRRLIEAGTPADLIAEVAMLAADAAALERRRGADRARQQSLRDERASHDVTLRHVTSRDTADVTDATPSPNKSPPDPQKLTPTPAPTGRRTPRAREAATRLPDDWRPGKLDRSTVSGQIVENRGQEWAKRALEAFRNHWRSANGPNARKLDWQATFANWIIEQDSRDGRNQTGRGNGQRMGGPRPDPTLAIVRNALAAQRQDAGDCGDARAALPPG